MRVEIAWHCAKSSKDCFQALGGDAGIGLGASLLRATAIAAPDFLDAVLPVHAVAASHFRQLVLVVRAALQRDLIGLLARHLAELEQMIEVALAHTLARVDHCVHRGLRIARLVRLVMPVAAVAVEINHHVALELTAEFHRQLDYLRDRFRVLAVDVQDRALQHLRQVAGVGAAAVFVAVGGEADLVVGDDVQRAAGRIALKLA